MANSFRLEIITPEKVAYSQDVNMIVARAIDGDIGILAGHAPLITALAIWPLRIRIEETEQVLSLCGGFMEVSPAKVTILAACAERPDEIDIQRAEAAKTRAQARLAGNGENIDRTRAEAALQRAAARLRAAEYAKRK